MKRIVMVGAGKIAYAVSQYLRSWRVYEVVAYAADHEYLNETTFLDRPLVDLETIADHYPPSDVDAFVALGYQRLNQLRHDKIDQMRGLGYHLVSVVHPNVPSDLKYGENCFISEAHSIHPGVSCGDNVYIWSGAMIGHHAHLEDDCWITGGAMLGGGVRVGAGSFIGLGAKIGQEVAIGGKSIVGAGALVLKDMAEGSVIIEKATDVFRLRSDQFLRFSSFF